MRDSDPYDFDANQIDHDQITETYHLSFDQDEISSSAMVIIQLISYITETDLCSLPLIASVIESEYLDALLSSTGDRAQDLEVGFTYAGFQIKLNCRGEVWARPVDDTGTPVNGNDTR